VRFSPSGKYIAFDIHADPFDDRGKVVILRADGRAVAVSPMFESVQGIAWNPSGSEIWFTSPLESGEVEAMSLSGKIRSPLSIAGRLFLRDIAPNGQLLVDQGIVRRGFLVSSSDDKTQRDLSWLDYGYLRDLSDDGKTALFEEEGTAVAQSTYMVFVRNVDGSPAVALGPGYGVAISHDKQWVLADKLGDPVNEMWLLPVGAGEARRLTPPDLSVEVLGAFLSGDKSVVFVGNRTGRPERSWLEDLAGGPPRPITPEGIVGWMVSPDGQWLVTGKGGVNSVSLDTLTSLHDGKTRPIAGVGHGESIVGWNSDGQLYVGKLPNASVPSPINSVIPVDILNPLTGARRPWHSIAIPPLAGTEISFALIARDGTMYAWGYRFSIADLYTIDGAS
jgi:Tol biopolymer transport system component